MYLKTVFSAVLAVGVFCSSSTARPRPYESSDKAALITVHAAVVEAPLELFYGKAGDFVKPDPSKVRITAILNALARSEAIMVSKASTVCRTQNTCKCQKTDRVNLPVEKTVTGRGYEPYVITEYTWAEESLRFATTPILRPEGSIALDFEYRYKAPEFYFDKANNKDEVVKESSREWSASLILEPLSPVIAATAVDRQGAAFLIIYVEKPE